MILFIKYWILIGFICCTLTHLIHKYKAKQHCDFMMFVGSYFLYMSLAPIGVLLLLYNIIENFDLWGNLMKLLEKRIY